MCCVSYIFSIQYYLLRLTTDVAYSQAWLTYVTIGRTILSRVCRL